MRIKGYIIVFLLVFLSVTNIFAGWSGPSVIISETWGTSANQSGFKAEDTADSFPEGFWLLGDRIIIRDQENRRMKIYGMTGVQEKIVNWIRQTNGSFNIPEYPLAGDFAGYIAGNLVTYYSPQQYYVQYSPTGQIITTSTTRPLELGIVNEKAIAENQYKISIKYPDKTYELITDRSFMRYVRDNTGNINAIDVSSVSRFDQCGKKIGEMNIPKSGTETVTVPSIKLPVVMEVEYGQPVVAPNGDVYTWGKTSFKYSILKWTWADDPNVLTGPDAPSGLTVTPSTSGLYLAWKASPNDPGCVTGYEVARATTSGGVFSTVGTVEKGVVKYNDTTAEVGTQYYYKVRAMAGSDPSSYTAEVAGKR